jgi:hypothetical protein
MNAMIVSPAAAAVPMVCVTATVPLLFANRMLQAPKLGYVQSFSDAAVAALPAATATAWPPLLTVPAVQ